MDRRVDRTSDERSNESDFVRGYVEERRIRITVIRCRRKQIKVNYLANIGSIVLTIKKTKGNGRSSDASETHKLWCIPKTEEEATLFFLERSSSRENIETPKNSLEA